MFLDPQAIQLPIEWTPMDKPWDRILVGKREDPSKWSKSIEKEKKTISNFSLLENNEEIKKLLKYPHMLPEGWLMEVSVLTLFFCVSSS